MLKELREAKKRYDFGMLDVNLEIVRLEKMLNEEEIHEECWMGLEIGVSDFGWAKNKSGNWRFVYRQLEDDTWVYNDLQSTKQEIRLQVLPQLPTLMTSIARQYLQRTRGIKESLDTFKNNFDLCQNMMSTLSSS
jgi:hypothetical protein